MTQTVTGPRPVIPSQGASTSLPGFLLFGGSGGRLSILACFLAAGSGTPAALAIAAIGSPPLALLLMSPVLSTPIVSPLTLLTSQAEATTLSGRPQVVDAPMLTPESFSCSDPKSSGAQTRNSEAIKRTLLSLASLGRREDLVLMGDAGTGKTHMLGAICSLCCQQMRPARFFTASSPVMRLRRARDAGSPDRELAQLARAGILGTGELGFLPPGIDEARLLFQVTSKSYEQQSLVITTNLEFARWGTVFGDGQMAAAVTGRICHHGRLLKFSGESWRKTHALIIGREHA